MVYSEEEIVKERTFYWNVIFLFSIPSMGDVCCIYPHQAVALISPHKEPSRQPFAGSSIHSLNCELFSCLVRANMSR